MPQTVFVLRIGRCRGQAAPAPNSTERILSMAHDTRRHNPRSVAVPARTTQPPAAVVLWPEPDTEPGPTVCPTCGRPFGPASSALLDLVVLTHEQLGKIKAVLETVMMP